MIPLPPQILATASRLLGATLASPVDLGGHPRSTVLRARREDGTNVVVKAHGDTMEGRQAFTAEASGLAFSEDGPALLAADPASRTLVMEDLGAWPTLADVLLGDDPALARATLLEWARVYGRIAAASRDRAGELDALRERYDAGAPADPSGWIGAQAGALPGLLESYGAAVPSTVEKELASLADVASGDDRVFSPGDICPDNNLLTDKGFRVIDFEGAGFHPIHLDAAYVRMPFATCWCVYRMPAEVAAEVERAYWDEARGVGAEIPAARVREAMAVWTLDMTGVLLPRVRDEDRPMHRVRKVATTRQVLRHRWAFLAGELEAAGELPGVAAAMRGLLAATDGWGTEELGMYPAFR